MQDFLDWLSAALDNTVQFCSKYWKLIVAALVFIGGIIAVRFFGKSGLDLVEEEWSFQDKQAEKAKKIEEKKTKDLEKNREIYDATVKEIEKRKKETLEKLVEIQEENKSKLEELSPEELAKWFDSLSKKKKGN